MKVWKQITSCHSYIPFLGLKTVTVPKSDPNDTFLNQGITTTIVRAMDDAAIEVEVTLARH